MRQEHENAPDLADSAIYCVAPLGSAQDFKAWADNAGPGQTGIYFVGHLAVARDLERQPFGLLDATKTNALAITAMRLSDAGAIQLTQRRVNDGCYLYMAKRTMQRLVAHA